MFAALGEQVTPSLAGTACRWHMDCVEEHTQHLRPGLPVSFQLSPGKQKCGLFSGCWWPLRYVPFSCVTADLLDALANFQRDTEQFRGQT